MARASGTAAAGAPEPATVIPAALRITAVPAVRWAGVEPTVPAAPTAGAEGGRPPVPEELAARDLRRLRGEALALVLAGHRPVAWHYATHVLGLSATDATEALVERALARALATHRGWRRLRRRPAGFRARLDEAVRVEAWRHQRGRARRRT